MPKYNQRGAALVVGIIILTVVTIAGLSSMSGGSMQERMASNQNNKAISFMSAEAGAGWFMQRVRKEINDGGHANEAAWNTWANSLTPPPQKVSDTDFGFFEFANISFNFTAGNVTLDVIGESRSSSANNAEVFATTRLALVYNLHGSSSGFPPPEAAYTCYGQHCTTATGSNSGSAIYYDGRDWNLPASTSCTGSNCNGTLAGGGTTGIYLIGNTSSNAISTGNQAGDSRPEQIRGDPLARQQTDQTNADGEFTSAGGVSVTDWNDYVSDVLASTNPAPVTINASSTNQVLSNNLGNRSNPNIVHITGSGSIQMSGNTHGAGVMIIDGPIAISPANGTATFEGLIILRNGARFTSGSGTFNVFGSIISLGGVQNQIDADFGGNFMLKYSSQALGNIMHLGGGGNNSSTNLNSINQIGLASIRETI